jgi:hypothetical protein
VCIKPEFRFPFVASEIFNLEINTMLDKFFDYPEPEPLTPKASDAQALHNSPDHVLLSNSLPTQTNLLI